MYILRAKVKLKNTQSRLVKSETHNNCLSSNQQVPMELLQCLLKPARFTVEVARLPSDLTHTTHKAMLADVILSPSKEQAYLCKLSSSFCCCCLLFQKHPFLTPVSGLYPLVNLTLSSFVCWCVVIRLMAH